MTEGDERTEGFAGLEGFARLVAAAKAIHLKAAAGEPQIDGLELAGIGWATVELERAAREVGAAVGIDPGAWVAAPRDALLGARAWVATPEAGGPAVVLLEPDTEGRLAATLARFGEVLAAVYLRDVDAAASAPGSAAVASALGPGRLVRGAPAWGPYVLLLAAPDPPDPPDPPAPPRPRRLAPPRREACPCLTTDEPVPPPSTPPRGRPARTALGAAAR